MTQQAYAEVHRYHAAHPTATGRPGADPAAGAGTAGALSAEDLRRPSPAAGCRRQALPGPGRRRVVAHRQPDLRGGDPLSRRPPRQGLQHDHRQPDRASVLARPAARSRRTRAVHDARRHEHAERRLLRRRRARARRLRRARHRGHPGALLHRLSARSRPRALSPHVEGWYDEIVATGPDGLPPLRRIPRSPVRPLRQHHLVHRRRLASRADARAGLDAIAAGIRSTGVKNLFTAHLHPEYSPIESFPGADWLDVNITYTYGIVHRSLLDDWQRDPAWPFFLHRVDLRGRAQRQPSADPPAGLVVGAVRRQRPLHGQQSHLAVLGRLAGGARSAGSLAMARWGAFFRALPWSELVPDSTTSSSPAGSARRAASTA